MARKTALASTEEKDINSSNCQCDYCKKQSLDFENDTGEISPEDLITAAKTCGTYVYDLETSGVNVRRDRIEGIAFYVPEYMSSKPIRAWFPFVENTMVFSKGNKVYSLRKAMPQRETLERLRPIWALDNTLAITANGKFDMSFLRLASGTDTPIEVTCKIGDSMLADYISDERRRRYRLKIRVFEEFCHRMTTYEEASRRQGMFSFMGGKPLGVYSMDDCYWTYQLHEKALKSIRAQDPSGKLEKIYWDIEMKLVKIVMEMETTGCLIDWEHLVDLEKRLEKEKADILADIIKERGWAPNLRSPKQVSEFLFGSVEEGGLGLPTDGIEQGVDGNYSTAVKVIKHFGKKNKLVSKLLDYRSLEVVDRSFCKKLIKIAQEEERVHTGFNQTGTVTGRLSCLPGYTKVLVGQPGGKYNWTKIKKVKVGDTVVSFDDTLNITFNRVTKSWCTGKQEVIDIFFDSTQHGNILSLTKNHPVRVFSGEYIKAEDIKVGDILLGTDYKHNSSNLNKTFHKVIKTGQESKQLVHVYDLEIESTHNFIANGVCVHNSSRPVNLQNQPKGVGIRKAYVAKLPGNESDLVLSVGDHGQFELRYAAHLSKDPSLLEVYNAGDSCKCDRFLQGHECLNDKCSWSGEIKPTEIKACPKCKKEVKWQARCRHVDVHQKTAEDVGVPRGLAKNLNFGTLYKIGPNKFAVTADLFDEDGNPKVDYSREIINKWMETYWRIPEWHWEVEEQIKSNNWVISNIVGRRRRLDQEKKFNEYGAITQGINFLVQSGTQDIMKLGMIRVFEERNKRINNSLPAERKKWETLKFLAQIHDEVVFSVSKAISDESRAMIKEKMESVAKLRCPLVFQIRDANNWEDAH